MKKHIKRFTSLLFILVLMIALLVPVASGYTAYPYKIQDGIRNRYCYFDSSVYGFWSTSYYNGLNRWYNTSTYFAFTQTTTWSSSTMDLFTNYDTSAEYGGYCDYFITGGAYANPYAANWKYCELMLNRYGLRNATQDQASGTAAHEMGHITGLLDDDVNNHKLMFSYWNIRVYQSPAADDINGVNAKYPTGY